jgi:hypothetical protein
VGAWRSNGKRWSAIHSSTIWTVVQSDSQLRPAGLINLFSREGKIYDENQSNQAVDQNQSNQSVRCLCCRLSFNWAHGMMVTCTVLTLAWWLARSVWRCPLAFELQLEHFTPDFPNFIYRFCLSHVVPHRECNIFITCGVCGTLLISRTRLVMCVVVNLFSYT